MTRASLHAPRRWTAPLAVAAVALTALAAAAAEPARPLRLFLLSGQSNMKHVDPEASFTPRVSAALPDCEVAVVKFAVSGQLIRMWVHDWQPPAGQQPAGQGPNGRHYDALLRLTRDALADRPRPASVTLVWMQGEADANHPGYAELYPAALHALLGQLRRDLGRDDVDMVLGRISDFGVGQPDRPGWDTIRAEQVKFVEQDPDHRAWVDTDDLNGNSNGLHYTRRGYQLLGERFADAAVALLKARP